MRLFWFALKQCLNAFQTLAPARLATPAAGPFLPQNGRKNFASPHCASLQNFAFILVQPPLKTAFSCPFPPFPAFLHSPVPPRPPFITLHENSHPAFAGNTVLLTTEAQLIPWGVQNDCIPKLTKRGFQVDILWLTTTVLMQCVGIRIGYD